MKITLKVIMLLVFMGLTGCKVADTLTHFNIPFSQTVTIPASIQLNLPFNIPTPSITLNLEKTFETNITNKDLIEKLYLNTLHLKILKPEGEDFSILKSIEIYIEADGLTAEKIAWLDDVPSNLSTIELKTSSTDLTPYIMKNSFNLKINTTTDELNIKDYDIQIDGSFWVDAKILGI